MDYEDELDRMRAGRNQKGKLKTTGKASQKRKQETSVRGNRTYYHTEDGRNMRVKYHPSESRERQNGKRKRKRKLSAILLKFSLLALLLCTGVAIIKANTRPKGYWTVAVFGVDSRDGKLEKGALSDVEMVCSIDRATGEIKLVSVYRDTYLMINSDETYHKINEAYMKGGHKQAIWALNENLDLNIDDYATFNWKAVAQAIDILGGVDLDITDSEFAYINGFITETVNSTGIGSHHLKNSGMNHLDGVQAVAYSRLRLMDTDFNRTARQRKVLALAMEKAKQADFGALSTLVSTVFPQISTSIGINDVFSLAKDVKKYHIGETAGFPFARTTKKIGKMDCVVAATLESNVAELHRFLYNQDDYSPSSSLKKISARISQISGVSEPGKAAPPVQAGSSKKGNDSSSVKTEPAVSENQETQAAEQSVAEESSTAESVENLPKAGGEPGVEEGPGEPTNQDGSLIGPGADRKESTGGSGVKPETPEIKQEEEGGKGVEKEKGAEEIGPGVGIMQNLQMNAANASM